MKILASKNLVNMTIPVIQSNMQLFNLDSRISAFDIFDKTNPDILIIEAKDVSPSIIKNILERPHLRVVVINNDASKVDELKDKIGNSFTLMNPGRPFYNVIACKNASIVSELKSDIVCVEGADIENIEDWQFPISFNFKIFSSKKLIHHNNFCGIINEGLKLSAIKSSKYCIVSKESIFDAIGLGSIPIANSEFEPVTSITKEDVENNTNFHVMSSIFKKLGMDKESKSMLQILEDIK